MKKDLNGRHTCIGNPSITVNYHQKNLVNLMQGCREEALEKEPGTLNEEPRQGSLIEIFEADDKNLALRHLADVDRTGISLHSTQNKFLPTPHFSPRTRVELRVRFDSPDKFHEAIPGDIHVQMVKTKVSSNPELGPLSPQRIEKLRRTLKMHNVKEKQISAICDYNRRGHRLDGHFIHQLKQNKSVSRCIRCDKMFYCDRWVKDQCQNHKCGGDVGNNKRGHEHYNLEDSNIEIQMVNSSTEFQRMMQRNWDWDFYSISGSSTSACSWTSQCTDCKAVSINYDRSSTDGLSTSNTTFPRISFENNGSFFTDKYVDKNHTDQMNYEYKHTLKENVASHNRVCTCGNLLAQSNAKSSDEFISCKHSGNMNSHYASIDSDNIYPHLSYDESGSLLLELNNDSVGRGNSVDEFVSCTQNELEWEFSSMTSSGSPLTNNKFARKPHKQNNIHTNNSRSQHDSGEQDFAKMSSSSTGAISSCIDNNLEPFTKNLSSNVNSENSVLETQQSHMSNIYSYNDKNKCNTSNFESSQTGTTFSGNSLGSYDHFSSDFKRGSANYCGSRLSNLEEEVAELDNYATRLKDAKGLYNCFEKDLHYANNKELADNDKLHEKLDNNQNEQAPFIVNTDLGDIINSKTSSILPMENSFANTYLLDDNSLPGKQNAVFSRIQEHKRPLKVNKNTNPLFSRWKISTSYNIERRSPVVSKDSPSNSSSKKDIFMPELQEVENEPIQVNNENITMYKASMDVKSMSFTEKLPIPNLKTKTASQLNLNNRLMRKQTHDQCLPEQTDSFDIAKHLLAANDSFEKRQPRSLTSGTKKCHEHAITPKNIQRNVKSPRKASAMRNPMLELQPVSIVDDVLSSSDDFAIDSKVRDSSSRVRNVLGTRQGKHSSKMNIKSTIQKQKPSFTANQSKPASTTNITQIPGRQKNKKIQVAKTTTKSDSATRWKICTQSNVK